MNLENKKDQLFQSFQDLAFHFLKTNGHFYNYKEYLTMVKLSESENNWEASYAPYEGLLNLQLIDTIILLKEISFSIKIRNYFIIKFGVIGKIEWYSFPHKIILNTLVFAKKYHNCKDDSKKINYIFNKTQIDYENVKNRLSELKFDLL